jgi:hypothetical protein
LEQDDCSSSIFSGNCNNKAELNRSILGAVLQLQLVFVFLCLCLLIEAKEFTKQKWRENESSHIIIRLIRTDSAIVK